MKLGLDYGMEVTASHNPSEYNGIKLIVKEGRDAPPRRPHSSKK